MVSLNLMGKWILLKCVLSRFIKMTVSGGEWKSTVKLPIFVDNSSMTLEAPYDSLPTKSKKIVRDVLKLLVLRLMICT